MEISDFRRWKGNDKARYTMHFFNDAYTHLHGHVYWEFFVMIDGRINHILNDESITMEKNDYCLISPSDLHRFKRYKDTHSRHLNICITDEEFQKLCDFTDPDLYNEIVNRRILVQGSLKQSETDKFISVAERALMCEDGQQRQKNELIASLFFEVIHVIIEQQFFKEESYPEWLNLLIRKINSVENIDLGVEDIIRMSGFSHTHLLRQFKKHVGITIAEYVVMRKLHYCCNLLENSNCTTLEICSRIGFSSLSHLNHIFKKKYGMTPTEYRKKFSPLARET